MKIRAYILFFIILIGMLCPSKAQENRFVNWKILNSELEEVVSTTEILFRVNLAPQWYIYSVNTNSKNGKNASIWFRQNNSFKVVGSPESIYEIEYFNKSNNQKEYIIEVEGGFAQKIKVLKPNPIIKGQINYVLYNRGINQEIAQVYHFEIQLKTKNK